MGYGNRGDDMSPGAPSTAAAGQPSVRSPLGKFLFDHTIDEYPHGSRRWGYLTLAVLATVVLYYVYYTQTGVTPNILAGFHMSFAFYIGIIVVSNLLGAFASLPAGRTDRLGRTNVVIFGLLIVGLLTAMWPSCWKCAIGHFGALTGMWVKLGPPRRFTCVSR